MHGAGIRAENCATLKRFQPYGRGAAAAYRVIEDTQGNVWAFTQAGIFRAGSTGLEPLAPGMNAACAYSDRDGQLWVGRKGDGLVRFKDRLFTILKTLGTQKNTKPTAVLAGRDGKLWVGHSCGGLSLFDGRGFKTYDEKDGLSNSCVWALAEDRNDDLWLGTWGGGLFRFSQGKFTKYGKAQGLASNVVRAIAAAPDGSLWIATENGLSHMLHGRFHNYGTEDGLSSAHVVNVYRDRRGGIWAATSSGIDHMTGERFVPLSASPKIVDSQYKGLNEDSAGNLYALSAAFGVGVIRDTRLVSVAANLDTLSMLEFQQHEFWLAGNNGLFRLSADGLRRAGCDRLAPVDYARFGRADGLSAPTQSSLGVPNMAVTPDGKLWVATVQGLAVANLRSLPHTDARAAIFSCGPSHHWTSESSGGPATHAGAGYEPH